MQWSKDDSSDAGEPLLDRIHNWLETSLAKLSLKSTPLMVSESFHLSTYKRLKLLGDIQDNEASISTDDPADLSIPFKITAVPQNVRKAFPIQSWSEMSLASELSGSDALLGGPSAGGGSVAQC
jgi:hypothetical protein